MSEAMKSKLVDELFKDRAYYKDKKSRRYGRFVLDSEVMDGITIPRIIDIRVALKELTEIKEVFDKHNVDFFLTHGTCLGAIREKNFILHDSDIDIGCYKRDLDKVISAVQELRDAHGFRITKLSLRDESIAIIRDNVIIDLSLYKLVGKNWRANKGRDFIVPEVFFSSLDEIVFQGLSVKVPNSVIKYLEFQYGDWQHPVKYDHDPYRERIEKPVTAILKYLVGRENASKIAKGISRTVRSVRGA